MIEDSLEIIAASFEDRCIGYSKKLKKTIGNAILIDFIGYENVASYQMNLKTIEKNLSNMSLSKIKVYMKKPLRCINEIRTIVKKIPNLKQINLDISVLPRPFLYLLLEYLTELNCQAELIYTRAKSFGQKMSRGYDSCGPISHFIGNTSTDKNTMLILHLGFENIKTEFVWEKYSPHKTVAILGYVRKNDKWFQEAKDRNRYLLSLDDIETVYASSLDIKENYKILSKFYKKYSKDYNIIVSSIGTKLQAISAYLFAKKYPDVQIAYVSSARYFTEEFSRGIINTQYINLRKILKFAK